MRHSVVLRLTTATAVAAALVAALVAAPAATAGPRPAAKTSHAIVLGQKGLHGANGRGWGAAHPKVIDNGGDPSGIVTDLTWQNWGSTYSQGWGRTSIFKPGGGFYPHEVRAELRAAGLGHCTTGGPSAYTKLYVRTPKKPGGPLGRWYRWSGQASICG